MLEGSTLVGDSYRHSPLAYLFHRLPRLVPGLVERVWARIHACLEERSIPVLVLQRHES